MEIFLAGAPLYNIPGWNGSVDVQPILKYQYKRLANTKDTTGLFRKILKIFKSPDTTISFPVGLDLDTLALGDFLQLLVALTAVHERGVQKTFQCPKCKTYQPRLIDLLKVFIPKAPVNPKNKTLVGDIECTYISIGNYLKVHQRIDELYTGDFATVKEKLKATFGTTYQFNDEEDVNDFKDLLTEFGQLAIHMEYQGKTFEELVRYLMTLKGKEGDELSDKLEDTILSMSPDMESVYSTECTHCKNIITTRMEPTDYFFVTP